MRRSWRRIDLTFFLDVIFVVVCDRTFCLMRRHALWSLALPHRRCIPMDRDDIDQRAPERDGYRPYSRLQRLGFY